MRCPDVTLLLEGTYPYVSGGVSSWVHQLICGIPDLNFGVVFLGGTEDPGPLRYQLPGNVVHFSSHHLMRPPAARRARSSVPASLRDSDALHAYLKDPTTTPPTEQVGRLLAELGGPSGLRAGDFLFGEAAWQRIRDAYVERCSEPSFLHYFWTVRAMHVPLFRLAEVAREVPESGAYHAISCGYAGLLGSMLSHRRKRPFILTEHGLYARERQIELVQTPWLHESAEQGAALGYLRELWMRFFSGLSRLAYDAADPIITLSEGNRQRQLDAGADPRRTRVIPNGVDLARFAPLRALRPKEPPWVLGLVGRVVPIKDVRTFLRALRLVCDQQPEAQGLVVGPLDEDAGYAEECRALAWRIGLSGRVHFLGQRQVEEVLPRLGLLVLTSISEALPLCVLEGFASGLPVVLTDVGACRELVHGRPGEDEALGAAGRVTPIADPEATASAALCLLRDPALWRKAQQAAISRVERYYGKEHVLDSYRALYQRALSLGAGSAWWRARPGRERRGGGSRVGPWRASGSSCAGCFRRRATRVCLAPMVSRA